MPKKVAVGPKGGKAQAKKKANRKFVIDCTTAETDSILDCANFEKYLKERIKVGGKAGNLGEAVKVTTEKSKIVIQVEVLHRPHPLHCPGQSPGPPLAHASTHTAQSASMKLRVP